MNLASESIFDVDARVEYLERKTPADAQGEVDMDDLIATYRDDAGAQQPIWQLTQDVLERVTIYSNLIEQLKTGSEASDLRRRYLALDAVPEDLPNPDGSRMFRYCTNKLSKYRHCLVQISTTYGTALLNELGAGGKTIGLTVTLGIPPDLQISVEYTSAGAQTGP